MWSGTHLPHGHILAIRSYWGETPFPPLLFSSSPAVWWSSGDILLKKLHRKEAFFLCEESGSTRGNEKNIAEQRACNSKKKIWVPINSSIRYSQVSHVVSSSSKKTVRSTDEYQTKEMSSEDVVKDVFRRSLPPSSQHASSESSSSLHGRKALNSLPNIPSLGIESVN